MQIAGGRGESRAFCTIAGTRFWGAAVARKNNRMDRSNFPMRSASWHDLGELFGMITTIFCFLLFSALLSLLVHADHQAASAAEAVRMRDGDL